MKVKLDLQLFAGEGSDLYIYSNDGNTLLVYRYVFYPIQITSTGVSDRSDNAVYTYAGGKNFVGLALNANATTPDYAIGSQVDSYIATTYYIVEQDGVPYEHIYKDNHKVQVDSAIRDGNGVKIDTNYAKKSELPDVSGKMDKANPTGTGSLSLNRKANTTIGDYSVAEGYNNEASGVTSHAEGSTVIASGAGSHAEGANSIASGDFSHAEGFRTRALSRSQHTFGEYNILDSAGAQYSKGTYVEIVGNGTEDNARSNARTLDWSGNEVLAGSQTATSFIKSGGTSSQFLKADGSVDSSSYLTQHQDISGKQDKTDNSLQTSATTVVGAINEVNSLAKQSNKAKGFANYNALITELNSASATAYNIGQSFYIQTLNVPDLWIISVESSSSSYTYSTDDAFITATSASGGQQVGYYKIAQLETQKVDLTNYSIKAETVSNVSFNASSRKLQKTINGSTTDVVTFGTNAFNSNTIPTRYVSSVNGITGAITNIATTMDIPTSINGLSGGKLTSPLQISGGDAATASKIALDQTASGQITNNSTQTIFGFTSNNATNLTVGHSSYGLKLRGSGTRPQFNNNDLALYSDVPTVPTNISSFTNDSGYITSSSLLSLIYPVGSIYISIVDTSPASFIGGTWVQLDAGYALWTASSGAGNTISAGLPNISGELSSSDSNLGRIIGEGEAGTYNKGAFTIVNQQAYMAGGSYFMRKSISFNASNANSIYGNSSTVQPPAYKVYAWRRTA